MIYFCKWRLPFSIHNGYTGELGLLIYLTSKIALLIVICKQNKQSIPISFIRELLLQVFFFFLHFFFFYHIRLKFKTNILSDFTTNLLKIYSIPSQLPFYARSDMNYLCTGYFYIHPLTAQSDTCMCKHHMHIDT